MLNFQTLRDRAETYKGTAASILAKARSEGRDLTNAEAADFDNLTEKINGIEKTLHQGERFEELQQAAAKDTNQGYPSATRGSGDMTTFTAMVMALAAGNGDAFQAAAWAERRGFGPAAKALGMAELATGGILVQGDFSRDFVEMLRPRSVVRASGATSVSLEHGTLTLGRLTGSGSAAYLGENEDVEVSQQTFGALILTRKKLAALVPISNDLLRSGSRDALQIVRDDLLSVVATTEDANFIRGLGTGGGPRGLRYWAPAANILTVNATVNAANVKHDLGRLRLALRNANCRMLRPGWLMSERTRLYLEELMTAVDTPVFPEMALGRLRGYPFQVTTSIPDNLTVTDTNESELYLADFADVVIGDGQLEIAVSDAAGYVVNGQVVSAFSRDQTVIRVIARHDIGLRHVESVAVLSDVDWGA